jgi:Domain of unknown function (DUF305)
MHSMIRWVALSVLTLAAAVSILGREIATADAADASAAEAPFLAENNAAMTKMMDDMSIRPSGDVDQDFVAMMVPHHQGAIDMARAELRYGHNEKLRRLAQEIIVDQQEEITAMRLAAGQPLPPSVPAPDQDRLQDSLPTPVQKKSNNSTRMDTAPATQTETK